MSTSIQCPNPACGKMSVSSVDVSGRRVRCKQCGQSFVATLPGTTSGSTDLPTMIGRFQIREKLGTGAFGVVYRAYDPQLDRDVALKVPHAATLENAKYVERFMREAKSAAGLRHPHIVPIFDAGKDGDRYFIASAFIAGQKLSDTFDEKGTELPRCARIIRELAEALSYAHDQGIVHRDVKPDNIMIDGHDRVHLMDFGLAARQNEESRLTNDGAVMGTPRYMAPEQAMGQQGEAQPSADQYSVGIVMYELLTGHAPFDGPPAIVIHNRTIRVWDAKSGAELTRIRGISGSFSFSPDGKRIVCGSYDKSVRIWDAERGQRVQTIQGHPGRIHSLEYSPDGKRFVTVGDDKIVKVWDAVRGTEILSIPPQGENVYPRIACFSPEGSRIIAASYAKTAKVMDAKTGRELLVLKGQGNTIVALSYASDGKRIATTGFDGRVIVWDAITGQERLNFDVGTSAYSVALSPDGKWLAAGTAKGNLHIWNAATGQPERIIPKYTRSHIAFSSDSQRVAFAGNDSATHVRVCDVTTGKDVLVLKGHSGIVWRVCYSPDGTRIASASGDGTVKVWDASTGSELVTLREHNGLIDAVSFRPDGKQIATGGSDGTIKIWDATPLSD